MVSLYEMEQQYQELLDDMSGSPEDLEAWNALLDELTGSIDVKVTNIAMVVKQLESEKEAIAAEVRRLQDKKKTRENKVDRLKAYMLEGMRLAGIQKTTDVRAAVRIQKNPPKLHILNEEDIPSVYFTPQRPKLDTSSIKDALKDGDDIPGVELVQEEGVRIS